MTIRVEDKAQFASVSLNAFGDQYDPAVHEDLAIDLASDLSPSMTGEIAIELTRLMQQCPVVHRYVTVRLAGEVESCTMADDHVPVHLSADC